MVIVLLAFTSVVCKDIPLGEAIDVGSEEEGSVEEGSVEERLGGGGGGGGKSSSLFS